MERLEFHQMESIHGGNNCAEAERFIATVGLAASIGASFGPIGLAIFGPTALVMGVAAVACAYSS